MTWTIAAACLYAVFVWWFSTGVLLGLVRLPRASHVWIMAGFSLLLIGAFAGIDATGQTLTPAGAVAGFTYAIIVWAWVELTFLFGYVTGSRRRPMSPGAAGGRRFREALAVLWHHELLVVAGGIAVVVLSWGDPNQVATWTYGVLWAMRISAKLNLFFGAPSVSPEFLPKHLAYLSSYFNGTRISRFFPVSVMVASLAFGISIHALTTAPGGYEEMAIALVAVLLGLAIVEHWFLVLPIPDAALWRWALGPRPEPAAPSAGLPPPRPLPPSRNLRRTATLNDTTRGARARSRADASTDRRI